jgi:hypothetical protein
MDTPRCAHCALPRSTGDVAGLAWSTRHTPDGSVTWACGPCTRSLLWLVEAGLDTPAAPAPGPLRRAA